MTISTTEEKIVEILFKDKLIIDILVNELLPMIKFTSEFREDWYNSPEIVYKIARDNLASNLRKYL